MDGPAATEAFAQLARIWVAVGDRLGMTEPIPGLPSLPCWPADPSSMWTPGSGLAVVGAAQNDGRPGLRQIVLRREHDVLVLSFVLDQLQAARMGRDGASEHWPHLASLAAVALAGDTDALLGQARILFALGPVEARTLRQQEVSKKRRRPGPAFRAGDLELLPCGWDRAVGWHDRGAWTPQGIALWETGAADTAPIRELIAVAPVAAEADLSAWIWSDGSPGLPRLARYLLHAAKVRYEVLLLERGHYPAPVRASPAVREAALLRRQARLRDLRVTSTTAVCNLKAAAKHYFDQKPSPGTVFACDLGLGDWLVNQIGKDLEYLQNDVERVRLKPPPVHQPGDQLSRAGSVPTMGIVTALPEEFAAMRLLLDDGADHVQPGDRSPYVLGFLPSMVGDRPHRVVLTMLADAGNASAATSCAHLARSFPDVNAVVMTGIAAGGQWSADPHDQAQLGDVVVATWGVIAYDHVDDTESGRELRGGVPQPSTLLSQAARVLRADELVNDRPWEQWLAAGQRPGLEKFRRPGGQTALPAVHYGRIGAADRSLRNARSMEQIAKAYSVRAVEMEGVGVAYSSTISGLAWIDVRGISDQGDEGATGSWRNYASLTAAAYTRALLSRTPPLGPRGGHVLGSD